MRKANFNLLALMLMCFLFLIFVQDVSGEVLPEINPPTDLTATVVSSSQINLAWMDNSSNETGFIIERKIDNGAYEQISTVPENAITFADTGLIANKTYTYRVQAYNDAGNSAYSNETEATTAENTPEAPSNLSASVESATSIKITWTDNSSNETGFKIERNTSGGSYSQITTVSANATNYTDTGLVSGVKYYYRVQAYNTAGNSAYSNEVETTTGETTPEAPSNLSASAQSSTSIGITWADNSSNEMGFKIERKTYGGNYSQITTVNANTTSYTDTGLFSGVKYYYRVQAYNTAGNSAYSNEVEATTAETTPEAPSNLSVSAQSSTSIRITWADNSNNETGFKIERKTSSGNYSQITTVSANTTSYTNTGLSSNTLYYYRVRAYNSAGNSAYSGEDYTITNGSGSTPSAPSNLSVSTQSATSIRITWTDNSNNETGFKIERKTSGGNYSQIATVNANITSYTNTGLSSNTRYYYRVRAYNSAGDSLYSNEYSTTTSASTNTAATRIIKLTISKSAYHVNNQLKTMDTAPVIRENRTLLPIRYVAEAIGATVNWNNSERKVTVSLEGKVIELWIGKNTARVDGQYVLIDSANLKVTPVIISPGRTMLPLRFITENLGAKVDWDEDKKEVTVTYPAP